MLPAPPSVFGVRPLPMSPVYGAGSVTDFSVKPVSRYSYFSTGPFCFVFSVFSYSFFFFNHPFSASLITHLACLSRSTNIFAGLAGCACLWSYDILWGFVSNSAWVLWFTHFLKKYRILSKTKIKSDKK